MDKKKTAIGNSGDGMTKSFIGTDGRAYITIHKGENQDIIQVHVLTSKAKAPIIYNKIKSLLESEFTYSEQS